jgi:hypothetical protein
MIFHEIRALAIVILFPPVLLGLWGASSGLGVWIFFITLAVSASIGVFAGIPIILLLNKFRLRRLRYFLAVGFLVSLFLSLLFIYPSLSRSSSSGGMIAHLIQFFILLVLSEGAAILYWIIARPDRIYGDAA